MSTRGGGYSRLPKTESKLGESMPQGNVPGIPTRSGFYQSSGAGRTSLSRDCVDLGSPASVSYEDVECWMRWGFPLEGDMPGMGTTRMRAETTRSTCGRPCFYSFTIHYFKFSIYKFSPKNVL